MLTSSSAVPVNRSLFQNNMFLSCQWKTPHWENPPITTHTTMLLFFSCNGVHQNSPAPACFWLAYPSFHFFLPSLSNTSNKSIGYFFYWEPGNHLGLKLTFSPSGDGSLQNSIKENSNAPPHPDIGAIYSDHIVAALFCPLLNTWKVQQSIFFKTGI